MTKSTISINGKVYTFGHSTQSLEHFIETLKKYSITRVFDVRTVPRSRHNPQFNKETLPQALEKAGIKYYHAVDLGGLRRPAKESFNLGWENESFRAYADYMQTKDFEKGLNELLENFKKETVVLLCAEGLWWRCHRRMIADVLILKGYEVIHILPNGKMAKHELTPFLEKKNGKITYPKR